MTGWSPIDRSFVRAMGPALLVVSPLAGGCWHFAIFNPRREIKGEGYRHGAEPAMAAAAGFGAVLNRRTIQMA